MTRRSHDRESEPIIFSYTRAQAIADGVLVDVSTMAKEAGFRIPVAMTRTVWEQYICVPPGVAAQDETGRLWDVLWMLFCAIRASRDERPQLLFRMCVRNQNHGEPKEITLKSVCGAGDDAAPVVTIMLPEED